MSSNGSTRIAVSSNRIIFNFNENYCRSSKCLQIEWKLQPMASPRCRNSFSARNFPPGWGHWLFCYISFCTDHHLNQSSSSSSVGSAPPSKHHQHQSLVIKNMNLQNLLEKKTQKKLLSRWKSIKHSFVICFQGENVSRLNMYFSSASFFLQKVSDKNI